MRVINLFGGPGTGKSTTAAGLFHHMKIMGLNVELVTEYAKDMTWEQRSNILDDQLYILAKQNRRLERLRGKVDWVVTDSPVNLGLIYTRPDYYRYFEPMVLEIWDSYENVNFMLTRSFDYQSAGRNQDEAAAKEIDNDIAVFLKSRRIPHYSIDFKENPISGILQRIGVVNN